jgi:hypothetical protein
VILNQLLGAQRCDGSAWGYYVQMEGKKPYSSSLDGHCCLSSGPRGLELISTFASTTDAEGVVVNLYDEGTATLELRGRKTPVTLTTKTRYPGDGKVLLNVQPASPGEFCVKLRIPSTCPSAGTRVNGKKVEAKIGADGYLAIKRKWTAGDQIELQFELEPRVITGDHKNQGKIALACGPLVLAADAALLPSAGADSKQHLRLNDVAAAGADLPSLRFKSEPAGENFKTWPGARVYRINAVMRRSADSLERGAPVQIGLVPFADAGGTGSDYKVWLPLPRAGGSDNLLLDGKQSRSRPGNVDGSINDDDEQSVVVTFDGKPAPEDWFAVALDEPVTAKRIVFAHGKTFHDGGWFDTSGGKPRIEVKTAKDGQWETVGELKDYPAATATSSSGLKNGEKFECRLAAPVKVWAVRVIGKPACGDNPQQAFASCAELQAFGE